MKDLDRLAPDQRAVLALVLDQDKSYEQVAAMLGMSERAVRDRAHAALDALAREANGGGRLGSPLGAGRSGSRLGGALLLGGILAVVAIAVVLISSGGKGSGQAASRTTSASPSSPSSTSSTSGNSNGSGSNSGSSSANGGTAKIDKTLPLAAVEPSSKAAGIAYVLSQSKRRAFYVRAEGMSPSSGFFYAVWLYDSPSSAAPLGRAPKVTSNGRLEGGGPLPANAGSYQKIVVTRETDVHAAHPGEVVLSGAFALR